ncbi:MAG: type II secretion system F family protein [Lentisphaeria bacterium]|nr:type II secretion system F family protein [Lentisphaeria bacterium]
MPQQVIANQVYITYALVFTATALFAFLAVVTLFKRSQEKFEISGNAARDAAIKKFIEPGKLLRVRFSSAMLAAAVILLILISVNVLNPFIYVPVAIGVGILFFMLPYWYYLWKGLQRKEKFESKLLDLTMGLANGMKSGLAFPQALEATSRRIGGPMQEELNVVLREYRLGLELAESLERLNQRMPCEDLHLLVTTIKLTTKSGGSLVDVLEKMVETIRSRTEFQERLKNMTAAGRFEALAMSCAPVAAFILLYLVDPDLMGPMLTTKLGWCGIAAIAALVSIGFYIINKIVTIEV